jgi:hypothetical protein
VVVVVVVVVVARTANARHEEWHSQLRQWH